MKFITTTIIWVYQLKDVIRDRWCLFLKIDSLTDIGVKRTENQDNFWSARLLVDGEEAGIICLCDGMGGLSNGRLASKIVVENVKEFFKSSIDFEELERVLQRSNRSIYDLASGENVQMGTTCTVLFCYRGMYRVLHVGDSRCYIVRGDSFSALTRDHSALVKYNIKKSEAPDLYKKYKNSLTRCIGVMPEVRLDYFEGVYESSDIFFCCSDGLWHYFDDYEFSKDLLSELPDLIKKCIDAGETDNITVGVLSMEGSSV